MKCNRFFRQSIKISKRSKNDSINIKSVYENNYISTVTNRNFHFNKICITILQI